MILKIKGRDSEKDWWIFPDVQRVHYDEMTCNKMRSQKWDIKILEETESNEVSAGSLVLKAIVNSILYSELIIFFDTIGYLCTDKGDTVETIYISEAQNP